jgi:SAM-dependent methyltransferase
MIRPAPNLIFNSGSLNLELIKLFQEKPVPFTPGEELFWDDPHISKQMLSAHLDPTHDLASRKPETIERSVAWIIEILELSPEDAVLDLGCGPGLYTARFAQQGLQVTGVDYSRRSIDYATYYAREHNLDICYRYQDYLTLEDSQEYDVVLLIFGDFCVLAPDKRDRLLKNVLRALKPGGYFILDVTTREYRKRHEYSSGWYVIDSGFWKPGLHLVLDQGFDYPEQSIALDQSIVIEATGELSVYRMWFQDYDNETIVDELDGVGFAVQSIWSDLTGISYAEDTEWIGVVSQKA